MANILLLGGAGFIGSNLAEALVQSGHEVTIMDRPGAPKLPSPEIAGKITWIAGSTADQMLVGDSIAGQDVVCHLASTTIPKTSNDDPKYDVDSNLISTLGVLDACRDHKVKKFVYLSSGGTVYGNTSVPLIAETHPNHPISSYGIVKLAVENYLHLYNTLHGLNYVALRLSNPYGKYQRFNAAQGAIAVFLHRAMTGQPIEIWGDGEIVRDYIYISDVVAAIQQAIAFQGESGVFNLGGGAGYSLNSILAEIGAILGKDPEVFYLPGRPSDVQRNVLDITKITTTFGWTPRIDLHTGIALTHQYKLSTEK